MGFNKPPELIKKLASKCVQKCSIPQTVTLNEGQGYSNWNQYVQCSGIYHHAKFERHLFVNVWTLKCLKSPKSASNSEYWSDKIKWVYGSPDQWSSTAYQIPSKSTDNFVRQLAQYFLLFFFLLPCGLEPRSRPPTLYKIADFRSNSHLEPYQFINIQMCGKVNF